MEDGAFVAEALLAGAESPEVLRSFGNHISVELQEQKQSSQTRGSFETGRGDKLGPDKDSGGV